MERTRSILVVGASRGIGKELALCAANHVENQVIATLRKPLDFNHPRIKTLITDQTVPSSVQDAALNIQELDILIINAAIGGDESILSTDDMRFHQYLDTNVVGPLRVVKAFLSSLRARQTRKIVIISSTSGSMEKQLSSQIDFGGPYAISKAALNMLVVQLHRELHNKEGFKVVAVHPGWVATDMGNLAGSGGMPPSESAQAIWKIIDNIGIDDSAKFYQWDGQLVPW